MAREPIFARVKLHRFKYQERDESGEEWKVEPLTFGHFNLLLGRNATGKTRLLKAIARAAGELSGEVQDSNRLAQFEVVLDNGSAEGTVDWAKQAQYLPFAGEMNLRRQRGEIFERLKLVEALQLGRELFGPEFNDPILQKMAQAGYALEEMTIVRNGATAPSLEVREPMRHRNTPFRRLSQAQKRALTFVTFLTFLEAQGKPATLLVDDFAEGLDFDHSARLTELVLRDYSASPLQFLMASNDRYVMNTVPLEHWTVLVELGDTTRVFNYENSKKKFDDFKFTGLNNFDFFSMDFAPEQA